MPYGTLSIDRIIPDTTLNITGNVATAGNLTTTGNVVVNTNLLVSGSQVQPSVLGTSQTASGSSVDFTNIPSWVKRITIAIANLTYAAATGGCQVRIGSGAILADGYLLTSSVGATHTRTTIGLGNFSTNSTTVAAGSIIITHLGNNIWVSQGIVARYSDTLTQYMSGTVTLSGPLDRISLVTTTSSFVSGTVNIMYE